MHYENGINYKDKKININCLKVSLISKRDQSLPKTM